ncbi:MAG: hypothetical protein WBA51_01500 [Erythrobacter sp.]
MKGPDMRAIAGFGSQVARVMVTVLVTVLIAALLSGCDVLSPLTDAKYRFRMTVEVETPEGIKRGSSVYEVTAGLRKKILPDARGSKVTSKGEAVAVDIAPGQTLFALLKNSTPTGTMAELSMTTLDTQFASHRKMVDTAEGLEVRGTDGPPALVDPEFYPMLVTFGDLDDPTSVARVDPDDLAATFGEGVALKRITVQLTDDPVTTGIEERLGWLEQVGRARGTLIPNPPQLLKDARSIDLVGPSAFSTEIFR